MIGALIIPRSQGSSTWREGLERGEIYGWLFASRRYLTILLTVVLIKYRVIR